MKMTTQTITGWPKACIEERCTYFTHYLRHGPGTIPHAAYHAAERECERWQEKALSYKACPPAWVERMCQKLEAEIRA